MATPELDQDTAPDAEPTPLTGAGTPAAALSMAPRSSFLRHFRELLDMIKIADRSVLI